jgi:hypothetical protein
MDNAMANPVKELAVPKALETQSYMVRVLEEKIDVLGERLSLVMRDAYPESKAECVDKDVSPCELCSNIEVITTSITHLAEKVSSIIDRLEV